MKTVLLFGAFDGLHPGHEAMLKEAWANGDRIVVALATDSAIWRLKGHVPKHSFEERVEALESSGLVDEVLSGDENDGEYRVIDAVKPDIVAFGYDQSVLQENFLDFLRKTGKSIATITLQPFEPERYKSSYDRH